MTTAREKAAACRVRDLGLIGYDEAYVLQKQYVKEVLDGGPPVLLLCEHHPVVTLGRSADERHMRISREDAAKQGVGVRYVDRGGDVTLHAPGQLVVYPILDLGCFGKDLRFYLRRLEQVAIDLLRGFDIVASRLAGLTGVWVGDRKIASIGIGVRRWISFHGLAVNVSTDLRLFSMIRPCGLDVEMTSVSAVKGGTVGMGEVKAKMAVCFCKNFRFDCLRN